MLEQTAWDVLSVSGASLILVVISYLWIVCIAFDEGVKYGVATILFPPYAYCFIVTRLTDCWFPAGIHLVAVVTIALMSPYYGQATKVALAEAQKKVGIKISKPSEDSGEESAQALAAEGNDNVPAALVTEPTVANSEAGTLVAAEANESPFVEVSPATDLERVPDATEAATPVVAVEVISSLDGKWLAYQRPSPGADLAPTGLRFNFEGDSLQTTDGASNRTFFVEFGKEESTIKMTELTTGDVMKGPIQQVDRNVELDLLVLPKGAPRSQAAKLNLVLLRIGA